MKLTLSNLPKTWFIDFDGTLCQHGLYYHNGRDEILPNIKEFFAQIPPDDVIIITTARESEIKQSIIDFMAFHQLRYNQIICDLPIGERILINDNKQQGLVTAYSIALSRNMGIDINIVIDDNI